MVRNVVLLGVLLVAGCGVASEDPYVLPPQALTTTLIGENATINYVDGRRARVVDGKTVVESGDRLISVGSAAGGGVRWKTFRYSFKPNATYTVRGDTSDGMTVIITEQGPRSEAIIR